MSGMELRFLGGASTVTGSQYLLVTDRAKVLVDCGMFQGSPNESARNRVPFAFDPKEIDALILTHAHLDHCGLIPHLVAEGFKGPIFATKGTLELANLVLIDSAKLQQEFADRTARRARRDPARAARDERRGHKALDAALAAAEGTDPEALLRAQTPHVHLDMGAPLYLEADVVRTMALFKPLAYSAEFAVASGIRGTLFDAGHILGSAMIRLTVREGGTDTTIVFSGDLGRNDTPIIRDPTALTAADHIVVESTYGGREHEPETEALRVLSETVRLVAERKGVMLVPSFAIGRTQEVVFQLDRLIESGAIPHLPLYLDSPMASKATEIYRHHAEYFDDETKALLARTGDPLDYPGAVVTSDVEASKKIRDAPRPYLIVASNGMLTGGRVLYHLRDLIDDPSAVILFVGYQGQGTLGSHLQQGVKTVTLMGESREVRCTIRSISGFSAHADESELLAWIGRFAKGKKAGDPGFPRTVFIVHGDPEAQRALEPKIRALGLTTKVPAWREVVPLR
ncbi:MAG: MBL fold metallo-hydrolase [Chloroflexi bacterium]|nr:MBL fold metallo-hydrolase [Chloroflexota bacterium]